MKLSIITINFNNLSGLQKTMQSVFQQAFTDYEYIVIDGASTDGSKEYVKKYANLLRYWISEKDKGIYNAMNKGIVKASGQYLMFVNSGDFLCEPTTLKKIFESSANEDIIYGNLIIDRGKSENSEIKCLPDRLTFKYFFKETIPHCSSVIKSSLFQKLGLYNETNKVVSDWEFFIKAICLYQASYKHLDFPISHFNQNGISSKIQSGQLILDERQKVMDKYFYPILSDFIEIEDEKKKVEERLNLYNNSRLHKIVEKIIKSPLYKSFNRL